MSKEPVNCTDSELCTYLQALAEGYLPTYYSDTSPSAPSRSITIASKSYRRGRKTVAFPGFQFSMTCESSTASPGADLSTSSRADFPVRTSAPQAREQESTASVADCGEKWRASLAKYDPVSRSWKTRQCLLGGGLAEYAETWPRWGTTVDGELYRQPTPYGLLAIRAYITSAKESGLSPVVPTPTLPLGGGERSSERAGTGNLHYAARTGKLPTPRASDGEKGGPNQRGSKGDLMLPSAVMRLPTSTALDSKSGKASQATMERNSRPLSEQVGGQLNPEWVAWLQGFPIEWINLEPLEMLKFQRWQRLHGEF